MCSLLFGTLRVFLFFGRGGFSGAKIISVSFFFLLGKFSCNIFILFILFFVLAWKRKNREAKMWQVVSSLNYIMMRRGTAIQEGGGNIASVPKANGKGVFTIWKKKWTVHDCLRGVLRVKGLVHSHCDGCCRGRPSWCIQDSDWETFNVSTTPVGNGVACFSWKWPVFSGFASLFLL